MFPPSTSNKDIYEGVAEQMVDTVMQGYNGKCLVKPVEEECTAARLRAGSKKAPFSRMGRQGLGKHTR